VGVVVVEGVVEVLPDVFLGVQLILVEIVMHANMRETILQLGVVVIRNRSEGIEQVRVNLAGLWHILPLILLGLVCRILHVGLDHVEIDSEDAWVNQKVCAPADTA
jgi:hypothetical protein